MLTEAIENLLNELLPAFLDDLLKHASDNRSTLASKHAVDG